MDLQDARAADYLKRLLSREVWLQGGVEHILAAEVQAIGQEIRKHLQLGKIEDKLQDEMKTGLIADKQDLAKRCNARSRRLVLWCEFSARLFR